MKATSTKPAMSMTGFARVRTETPQGTVTLTLRGVNHRALDLHFHLPSSFDAFETAVRKAIQARVIRGHMDVRVSFERAASAENNTSGALNRDLMATWLHAFEEAKREFGEQYGLTAKPDLNAALRLPGMIASDAAEELGSDFEAALVAVAERALDEFNASRSKEGAALVDVLLRHLATIRRAAEEIGPLRQQLVEALHARLKERLSELLGTAAIEPARLAQEAAILADRGEIAEELARLRIHCDALETLLRNGGEMGKRIDFLLQEMQRETNTMLSKATSGGEPGRRISDLALSVKSEIEKIREQSLNLE